MVTLRRNGFLLVALLLIFVGLFAGCGQKKRAQMETGEAVVVRLGYPGSVADYNIIKDQVIPMFEAANPDIKIDLEYSPYNQFWQRLRTQIAAGEAPDFWVSDGVYFMEYAERGALRDLTEWIKRDLDPEKYFQLDFASDTQGRIWGVPREIQTIALYFNKQLFDQAGVVYPDKSWTWHDLLEAAKKLTNKEKRQYGFLADNWISGGWFNFINQNNGQILDKTRTRSMLNKPETIEAVEFMVDLIYKYQVAAPLTLVSSVGGRSGSFQAGNVAMMTSFYAEVPGLNKITGLKYDVAVLPIGKKRATSLNANPFVMNAKASQQKAEAAWRFIKFFVTNVEVQKIWAKNGLGIPILKEAVYSDALVYATEQPQNREAFIKPLEEGYGLPMDLNGCWQEWRVAISDAFGPAWQGKITAREAVLNAHQRVQQILDTHYSNK